MLSTRDLCGLEYLPELIKAGVMCFKIEGRMKTPEYVATVTRIYRKYIDLALSGGNYIIDDKDIEDLKQVFNRGNFSTGHLSNTPNTELVYKNKPNNIGIYIGNISNLSPNKGHVMANLIHSISIGDSISFENEDTKYTISELMVKGENVKTASKGEVVEIGRMKGNLNIGDKIFRLESKDLTWLSKNSYKDENKKIYLNASITLKENEPIILNVSTCKENTNKLFENISYFEKSELTPVRANSKPITKERILEQLNKTNDTIFTFKSIDIDLEDNLFLPSIKELNELRRNALNEIYYTAIDRLLRTSPKLEDLENTNYKSSANNKNISILLNILDENKNYKNLKNVNQIYLPLKYFSNKKYENVINTITNNFDTYIYLPIIIKSNYENLLNNLLDNSIDKYNIKGFVVSNLSSGIFIEKIKNKYKDKYYFIGNYTLNVFNKSSQIEYKKLGIQKLTISPELDENTLNDIINNKCIDQELIVYGKTPLMNMNYCVLGRSNRCYPTCDSNCQSDKKFYLKDRLGLHFRVVPDNIQTVSTIYNSKTLSINANKYDVSSYRIDILDEDIDTINLIVKTILDGNRFEGKEYTNGNMNREI